MWGDNAEDEGYALDLHANAMDEEKDMGTSRFSRRLARSRKIKIPSASNASDLFSFNQRGGNDIAWLTALQFLKEKKVLNFQQLSIEFINERGEACLQKPLSNRKIRYCAIHACNKMSRPSGEGGGTGRVDAGTGDKPVVLTPEQQKELVRLQYMHKPLVQR